MRKRYLTPYPELNQMVLLEMEIEFLSELSAILNRLADQLPPPERHSQT